MCKKIINRSLPLILYLVPLILLPLGWYKNMGADPLTFSPRTLNGIQVLAADKGRIGLIYFCALIIQCASVQNTKIWAANLSTILLIGTLLSFPLTKGTFALIITQRLLHTYYDIGLYLCVILLLLNMVFHVFCRKNVQ